MQVSFPESLDLNVTSRERFQFELEGISQVIFLLTRVDDATVQFQCFLRQQPIMDQKFAAKAGDTINIPFPADVLAKVRADIENSQAASPAAEKPATEKKQRPKKTRAPKTAPATEKTASETPAAPVATEKAPASVAAEKVAAPEKKPRVTRPKSDRRAPAVVVPESRRTAQNPDQSAIGRSLSPRTLEFHKVKIPSMKWIHAGSDHVLQGKLYREIVNTAFYPLSHQLRADPLHIFNFYLFTANVGVSLLCIDTHVEKYQGAKGVEALKSKLYRHIYSVKHYETALAKYHAEHQAENQALPLNRQYRTKPVEGHSDQLTLAQFKPNMKKLIRIGVPKDTDVALFRTLAQCKSYANFLGINLLLDKLDTDTSPVATETKVVPKVPSGRRQPRRQPRRNVKKSPPAEAAPVA